MRQCPQCRVVYREPAETCARDGVALLVDEKPNVPSNIGGYTLGVYAGERPGGFSFRATDDTGGLFLITIISGDVADAPELQQALRGDFEKLEDASIPYLAEPIEIGRDMGLLYIVHSAPPGPSLRDLLQVEGSLSEDRTRRLMEQVTMTLIALHGQGTIHGYISPDTISVFENEVTIEGFGLSNFEDARIDKYVQVPWRVPERDLRGLGDAAAFAASRAVRSGLSMLGDDGVKGLIRQLRGEAVGGPETAQDLLRALAAVARDRNLTSERAVRALRSEDLPGFSPRPGGSTAPRLEPPDPELEATNVAAPVELARPPESAPERFNTVRDAQPGPQSGEHFVFGAEGEGQAGESVLPEERTERKKNPVAPVLAHPPSMPTAVKEVKREATMIVRQRQVPRHQIAAAAASESPSIPAAAFAPSAMPIPTEVTHDPQDPSESLSFDFDEEPPASPRWRLPVLVGLGVAVAIGVALVTMNASEGERVDIAAVRSPPPIAPPKKVDPPEPALLKIALESVPSGATVVRLSDGSQLGQTPLDVAVESDDFWVELAFDGHQSASRKIGRTSEGRMVVSLAPVSPEPPPSPAPPPPAAAPAPPPKATVVVAPPPAPRRARKTVRRTRRRRVAPKPPPPPKETTLEKGTILNPFGEDE